MNAMFFPRLAADGIRKNRRLYLPYIVTCVGMVMMTYIINYLSCADAIALLPGAEMIQDIMRIGVVVITFFAALFLFYTNSFLTRRRKREFGLYSVLGMDRRGIGRVIAWETLFVGVLSLSLGLLGGAAASKLVELGFVDLMKGEITYTLRVSWQAAAFTALPFCAIFLLIMLDSLRQVWAASAISLLRSENIGERPPKANWFVGALGAVILGAAYYLAVTVQDPVTSLVVFMIAVLMVILATYLLMTAGSVVFCRLLQRRKSYYYQPNHFVSVSSMVYRMKRNGAGLASICILATMVLVMLASTSALFIGGERVILDRYPREITTWYRMNGNRDMTAEDQQLLEETMNSVLQTAGAETSHVVSYHTVATSGMLNGGDVIFDVNTVRDFDITKFSDVHQIYLISLAEYNAMMGTSAALAPDEVLVYAPRNTFRGETFGFTGLKQYRVKERIKECFLSPDMAMDIAPALMVVVPDVAEASAGITDADGADLTVKKWYYCFDTSLDDEGDIALHRALKEAVAALQSGGHDTFVAHIESRAFERQDFYSIYGGLFYLGILLSIVFIFAAVLIIYYKQISEGYEDQPRFAIMQKIGMTRKDIKRSINSQLLTVFFLPLLGAGLHLTFAFPIIEKLLMLFNLNDRPLFICTTLGSFLLFAVFYAVVYRVTAKAYYQIVSENS